MIRDCVCPQARHRHGTRAAYKKDRCRCFDCRIAAHSARMRGCAGESIADPGMWVPRCAVTRRIEALQTVGHSLATIGRRAGMSKQAVRDLLHHNSPVVHHATAAKLATVYDELWDKTPVGHQADRNRRHAAAKGFVGPLCWDDDTLADPAAKPNHGAKVDDALDEIAVERIMGGSLAAPARSAEREEAIRRLAAYGLPDFDIGQRVGMTGNNVQQFRNRHGIPSRVAGGGGVAA